MPLEKKLDILLAIYIGAIVSAELLGSKLITILGVSTSVGIYALPLTFVINDIVAEVVGKPRARHFVRTGLIVLAMLFVFVAIARILPPADFYKNNDAYRTVFGNSMRVILGSLTAFAVSEFTDVAIFTRLRKRWGSKNLWFRANASNIIGQLIDTTIFITIAFYMSSPTSDAGRMVELIIPYWLLKIGFSIIETPFTYLGVRWLRRSPPTATIQPAVVPPPSAPIV